MLRDGQRSRHSKSTHGARPRHTQHRARSCFWPWPRPARFAFRFPKDAPGVEVGDMERCAAPLFGWVKRFRLCSSTIFRVVSSDCPLGPAPSPPFTAASARCARTRGVRRTIYSSLTTRSACAPPAGRGATTRALLAAAHPAGRQLPVWAASGWATAAVHPRPGRQRRPTAQRR